MKVKPKDGAKSKKKERITAEWTLMSKKKEQKKTMDTGETSKLKKRPMVKVKHAKGQGSSGQSSKSKKKPALTLKNQSILTW